MQFGTKIIAETKYVPRSILTESVIGSTYEVRIKTEGVSNPEEAAQLLQRELPRKFPGLHITWIGIKDDQINIQLEGSPFVWATLLLFLPTILGLIGITTTLIGVYLVFAAVPRWVIGLLLVGIVLIVIGPRVGELAMQQIPVGAYV